MKETEEGALNVQEWSAVLSTSQIKHKNGSLLGQKPLYYALVLFILMSTFQKFTADVKQ